MNTPSRDMTNSRSRVEMTHVEPWDQPVDPAGLLDDLRSTFARHLVLPTGAYETLALWTLHTYSYQMRDVTAYLGLVSPEKRCGKTTVLMLLNTLVNRPLLAANISPPALFRAIEETEPTLLIDEADTFLKDNLELRGILNAGYTRESGYVIRVSAELPGNRERGTGLRRFSCWCPKVIAAIGDLPETLADRCIVIRMRRKMSQEAVERLKPFDRLEMRRKCARVARDIGERVSKSEPAIPVGLHDRAADLWEPLLALAEAAGGNWPQLARAAAQRLNQTELEGCSETGMLFEDIRKIFGLIKTERIFTRTLCEYLNLMRERPWREARRGGPINELWLSAKLRKYGITTSVIRIGENVGRGFHDVDFSEAFARYLPEDRPHSIAETGNVGERGT